MMNEWILSSSLLIAAVLLGRWLLRGKLSLRLQYALWLIVLVRLLVPVQLFTSEFGAGRIAAQVDMAEPVRQVYATAREDRYEQTYAQAYRDAVAQYEASSESYDPTAVEMEAQTVARQSLELDLSRLLYGIWIGGMAVMALVIIGCNANFILRLRRSRKLVEQPDCVLDVYVTAAVPTPCLFGFFRPGVYLTPEAAEDERIRGHVLAHELTHYRHLDHIWSVLRSVCLVIHWYNPLVWLAAKVSRMDAELACDEGALLRIGESQRADYGRTLIGLSCTEKIATNFVAATTMTGSARSLAARLRLLMRRPRNTVLALLCVILVGSIVVGCSFSGAPETTEPEETTQPAAEFDAAYFDGLLNPQLYRSEADWYPRALTSAYDDPSGIDLFQLFYAGIPGMDNTPTDGELAFLEAEAAYVPEFDLVRVPASEMDRVLKEYFGVTLAETRGIGLELFLYNEAADCYYHSHTDTNLDFREITDCEELGDGLWRVSYSEGNGYGGTVILRRVGDGWHIVSNQTVGHTPENDMSDQSGQIPIPDSSGETVEPEEEIRSLFGPDGSGWHLAALQCRFETKYQIDIQTFFSAAVGDPTQTGTDQEPVRLTEKAMNEGLETALGLDLWLVTDNCDVDPATGEYLIEDTVPAALLPTISEIQLISDTEALMVYRLSGTLYAAELVYRDGWKIESNRQIIFMEDYPNARVLTEGEIEQVRTAFASMVEYEDGSSGASEVAAFFTSYYEDVTGLNLQEFLRYYPTLHAATEEEFQALKEKYGEAFYFSEIGTLRDMPVPVNRIPVERIEATLRRYAGIGHGDLTEKYTELYLSETDSYYHFTSDFGPGSFRCTGGWVYDGGAVLYSNGAALFLTERYGDYFIQAHLPVLVGE